MANYHMAFVHSNGIPSEQPMTKLEEEMYGAISDSVFGVNRVYDNAWKGVAANKVTEVAKKYIERAWNCAYGFAEAKHPDAPSLCQWCKENGITSDNSVETIDPPY
jgi:hypothetical protein